MEYQYVIIPTGLKQDTWVQHIEAAPTDRSVVHHIVAYVRAPAPAISRARPTTPSSRAKEAKYFPDRHPDMVPDMGRADKTTAQRPGRRQPNAPATGWSATRRARLPTCTRTARPS